MYQSLTTIFLLVSMWVTPAVGQYAPMRSPHGGSSYSGMPGAQMYGGQMYGGQQFPVESSRVMSFNQPSASGYCGLSTCSPCAASPCDCPPVQCVPCYQCACDESGRQWAIDVSALGLFRSDPSGRNLFRNPLLGSERINAGDFDFAAAAGVDAGFKIYTDHPQLNFEFRAMLPDDWQDVVRESFTGSSVSVEGRPQLVTTGPRDARSIYDSSFRSLMLNLNWNPQWAQDTTWTAGVRSLTLKESLVSTLVDPSAAFPDEVVSSLTDNNLVGVHVGLAYNLVSTSNMCLKVDSRLGLFANDADQNSQLISLATPPVRFPANGSDTQLAGLIETGVQGRWQITSCLNATVGYRLIVLEEMALASDQLQSVNFLNQQGLNNSSTLVLQALRVGLELHY